MRRVLLAALLPAASLAIVVGLAALVMLAGREADPEATGPEAPAKAEEQSTLPRLSSEGNVCQGLLRRPDPTAPRVFAAEYTDTGVDFAAACAWGKRNGFSFVLKNRELDAWVQFCP